MEVAKTTSGRILERLRARIVIINFNAFWLKIALKLLYNLLGHSEGG